MRFSVKRRGGIRDLKEVSKINWKVKQVRSQETFGKQSCRYDAKNLFEPVKQSVENTSKNFSQESEATTVALEDTNDSFLGITTALANTHKFFTIASKAIRKLKQSREFLVNLLKLLSISIQVNLRWIQSIKRKTKKFKQLIAYVILIIELKMVGTRSIVGMIRLDLKNPPNWKVNF